MSLMRKRIIEKAREYLGTPFYHTGRNKGVGIDCIGLIAGVCQELNLMGYDNVDYSRSPDGKMLMKELNKVFEPIDYKNTKPGDILVLWFITSHKFPQHIGFLTEKGIIHTHGRVGKVVEHSLDTKWKNRICAAFKIKGID
ncbi:MAG: hypothetical protein FVQ84_08585 [Planctomycetes bacterium]|nr:hypothetical protein [Planctomycetota bacterium]